MDLNLEMLMSLERIIEEYSYKTKIWSYKIDLDCNHGRYNNYNKKLDILCKKMNNYKIK
jgi:hypothetical protein